jgi:hypothetical protein
MKNFILVPSIKKSGVKDKNDNIEIFYKNYNLIFNYKDKKVIWNNNILIKFKNFGKNFYENVHNLIKFIDGLKIKKFDDFVDKILKFEWIFKDIEVDETNVGIIVKLYKLSVFLGYQKLNDRTDNLLFLNPIDYDDEKIKKVMYYDLAKRNELLETIYFDCEYKGKKLFKDNWILGIGIKKHLECKHTNELKPNQDVIKFTNSEILYLYTDRFYDFNIEFQYFEKSTRKIPYLPSKEFNDDLLKDLEKLEMIIILSKYSIDKFLYYIPITLNELYDKYINDRKITKRSLFYNIQENKAENYNIYKLKNYKNIFIHNKLFRI